MGWDWDWDPKEIAIIVGVFILGMIAICIAKKIYGCSKCFYDCCKCFCRCCKKTYRCCCGGEEKEENKKLKLDNPV